MSKDNLDNLVEYIDLLNELKEASTLRAGYFYCYHYDFHKHYPKEELKFYDWYPFIFCFGVMNPKADFKKDSGQYFYGLNFHHIPVAARRYWLSKFQKMAKSYFDKGGYRRIPAINYEAILKIMKKAKIAVRKYRFDGVQKLRQVSLDEIDYLMEWTSNTYFEVSIKDIQARYAKFQP